MTVNLMINFARSGGTLVNKCLAAMPDMVVISEVNPLGGGWGARGPDSPTTVAAQARASYQFDIPDSDYATEVAALAALCKERAKTLVIRDWSFVNFVPHAENHGHPPNRLLALEALEGHCQVKAFALVRDAIDVWISRQRPRLDPFFQEYLAYIHCVMEKELPIFKYEDLCLDSDAFMKRLCAQLDHPFTESYRTFSQVKGVHGDTQHSRLSRLRKRSGITLPKRGYVSPWLVASLNDCAAMKEANSLVDYPVVYESQPNENAWTYWRRFIAQFPFRTIGWLKRKMRRAAS